VQVGVVLQAEGQVGAVGRRGRLVRQQLVLGRERQRPQVGERLDACPAQAGALEGVARLRPLEELVENGELRVSSLLVDRVIVGAGKG
jgi:hypothetical protein